MTPVEEAAERVAPDRPCKELQVLTILWAPLAGAMSLRVYPGLLLFAVVFLFGLVLGLFWCALAWQRFVVHRHVTTRLDRRGRLAWAFCPATGLLLAVLVVTQIPLAVRVKVSESALLRLVEESKVRCYFPDGRRAGAMFVNAVEPHRYCCFLVTDVGGLFNSYGLVYSRDGARPDARYGGCFTDVKHLVGRWWWFCARE